MGALTVPLAFVIVWWNSIRREDNGKRKECNTPLLKAVIICSETNFLIKSISNWDSLKLLEGIKETFL
jgi:hypothetical protein